MLYIVATPIGNLEDITLRALRILKEVDGILCEDTRHTIKLLNHYEIKKPLISYHSHTNTHKEDQVVQELVDGKTYALASDAGTPGISDPGYRLIHKAIAAGVDVIPIPGVSAVITALCASGAPTHHFTYLGFLPLKKGRKTLIATLPSLDHTVVLYEAPHRMLKLLHELKDVYGDDKQIILARELTKIHEEFIRLSLADHLVRVSSVPPKGEYVVLIPPTDER